jgi:hypothetical protein
MLCVPQSNGEFKAVMADQVPEVVQVNQQSITYSVALRIALSILPTLA